MYSDFFKHAGDGMPLQSQLLNSVMFLVNRP